IRQPQMERLALPPCDAAQAFGIPGLGLDMRQAGSGAQSADHMKNRIDLGTGYIVESRLRMWEFRVGDAEFANRRGHRDGLDPAMRDLRDIAQMPGGAEQSTM